MNQLIQWLESYQLILYSGGVTIALICAWVVIARQWIKIYDHKIELEDNWNRINDLIEEKDELLTDNSKLIEALSKKNGL